MIIYHAIKKRMCFMRKGKSGIMGEVVSLIGHVNIVLHTHLPWVKKLENGPSAKNGFTKLFLILTYR